MDEYARFARLYDPIVGPPLRSIHRAMARELVKRGCTTVVDLCCGTGLFVGIAAENGLIPTGVDLSPDMLAIGREKYPAIDFIECDATATPFSFGSFDAASISFGLHEKPDEIARGIFREALRIVRPGGVVLVADYHLPKGNPAPWTRWAIRLVERLAGREHHACFSRYMDHGGTVGFLRRESVEFELIRTSMSGWSGLFVMPSK